jgi:hypothetical protein
MRKKKSPRRWRGRNLSRQQNKANTLPPAVDPIENVFWRDVLDDTTFNAVYTQWARTVGTGALNGGILETPEFLEANRIYQMTHRGLLEAINEALFSTPPEFSEEEFRRLSDLSITSYEETIKEALKLSDKQKAKWTQIKELCDRNRDEAASEALKNPSFSLRALVHHHSHWTFQQPRLMEFIARLLWLAHHGKGGPNSQAAFAGRLLKRMLLPVERTGGGSPDLAPPYICRQFSWHLKHIKQVWCPGARKIIRQELRDLKASIPSYENRVEIVRRKHSERCGFCIVTAEEIKFANDAVPLNLQAYAIRLTARNFGITEKEVRKHTRDIRKLNH